MEEKTLTISGVHGASIVYEMADRIKTHYGDDVPDPEKRTLVRQLTPQVFLLLYDNRDFFRTENVMIAISVTLSDLDICRVEVFSGGGSTGDLDDLLLNPRKQAVKKVLAIIRGICEERRLEIRE